MARPRSLQDAPEDDGFPIRVASRMSGIEADTLRVWERRYGFPRPQRTQGGTRVYSRADVEVLKLIASALREGFRPSDVVGKTDEELARLLRAAGGTSHEEVREPAPRGSPRGTMDIVQSILDAVISGRWRRVRDELRRAAVLLGPKQFVVEVAGPLAVRVGELWQQGRVEVRHEHLLSEALSTQLRLLSAAFEETGARGSCPGDPAARAARARPEMTAVYLATRGVTPRTIGCDVPFDQIVAAAKGHDANAVGVSISRRTISTR
ncbi:MAG: MerR family transcriptional regulator [Polyangiaceae bacterium]|nr:MerR family transcriptional regulator [Polyangiaceae bacterium]